MRTLDDSTTTCRRERHAHRRTVAQSERTRSSLPTVDARKLLTVTRSLIREHEFAHDHPRKQLPIHVLIPFQKAPFGKAVCCATVQLVSVTSPLGHHQRRRVVLVAPRSQCACARLRQTSGQLLHKAVWLWWLFESAYHPVSAA
eukprot:COSAG02_NODE_30_length_50867_cov_66.594331_16_plen_144_part_00